MPSDERPPSAAGKNGGACLPRVVATSRPVLQATSQQRSFSSHHSPRGRLQSDWKPRGATSSRLRRRQWRAEPVPRSRPPRSPLGVTMYDIPVNQHPWSGTVGAERIQPGAYELRLVLSDDREAAPSRYPTGPSPLLDNGLTENVPSRPSLPGCGPEFPVWRDPAGIGRYRGQWHKNYRGRINFVAAWPGYPGEGGARISDAPRDSLPILMPG
ncbi:hypothetical protein BO71DRAFT_435631 [Aspergillus ellipticus CBS 707.79]|uniref:Uncharacterized protein n=1 Tax=Aspergillus ellipticus CBS 707.79 TaxID=1448320 RepID=A0A319CUX2_9EURO|nr:hypothetical protein BO71DRAFT_435631 [Aspergillus ellipticus CBS 707.79]